MIGTRPYTLEGDCQLKLKILSGFTRAKKRRDGIFILSGRTIPPAPMGKNTPEHGAETTTTTQRERRRSDITLRADSDIKKRGLVFRGLGIRGFRPSSIARNFSFGAGGEEEEACAYRNPHFTSKISRRISRRVRRVQARERTGDWT